MYAALVAVGCAPFAVLIQETPGKQDVVQPCNCSLAPLIKCSCLFEFRAQDCKRNEDNLVYFL